MTDIRPTAAHGGAIGMRGVKKCFDTFQAVNDVTLDIHSNEFFTFLVLRAVERPPFCG